MSIPTKATPRAWWVWAAAVAAYLISVTQRTSFGVVGLDATARYDAGASILATFSVVQLLVYAGLQIPVGAMVDRFGSRVMIASGAALMMAGQAVLAFSHDASMGFAGRVLVGAGDAMTFVSVMRLLPVWFPPRLNPLMSQFTASLGQVGQLVSLIPFAALLHLAGWTSAFLSLAGLSLLACILAALVVSNGPGERTAVGPRVSLTRSIRLAWARPGTRLGFWTHWICAFGVNVFLLSWGYPFLVSAQGVAPQTASAIMAIFVVVAIFFGPLVGAMVARFPQRRSNLVLLMVGLGLAAWTTVLLWPGQAPVWLLVVLVLCVAAGGPTSMVAFDYTRTENPPELAGAATGLANVGSFSGGLIAIWAIGFVLDLAKQAGGADAELYSLEGFKLAFLVLYVLYAVGIAGFLIERHRTRAQHEAIEPLHSALRRRLRG